MSIARRSKTAQPTIHRRRSTGLMRGIFTTTTAEFSRRAVGSSLTGDSDPTLRSAPRPRGPGDGYGWQGCRHHAVMPGVKSPGLPGVRIQTPPNSAEQQYDFLWHTTRELPERRRLGAFHLRNACVSLGPWPTDITIRPTWSS